MSQTSRIKIDLRFGLSHWFARNALRWHHFESMSRCTTWLHTSVSSVSSFQKKINALIFFETCLLYDGKYTSKCGMLLLYMFGRFLGSPIEKCLLCLWQYISIGIPDAHYFVLDEIMAMHHERHRRSVFATWMSSSSSTSRTLRTRALVHAQ